MGWKWSSHAHSSLLGTLHRACNSTFLRLPGLFRASLVFWWLSRIYRLYLSDVGSDGIDAGTKSHSEYEESSFYANGVLPCSCLPRCMWSWVRYSLLRWFTQLVLYSFNMLSFFLFFLLYESIIFMDRRLGSMFKAVNLCLVISSVFAVENLVNH